MNKTTKLYESVEKEKIQEESDSRSLDFNPSSNDTDVSSLHEQIEATASGFDVSAYKCLDEACGMVHSHDTTKHSTTAAFDADGDDFKMNPTCHCGYNEAAHRAGELGIADAPSTSGAANTAPIPDSAHRKLQRL